MFTALLAVSLAAGYLLGRLRPARRASSWARSQFTGQSVPRSSWRWWVAQVAFAGEIAVLLTTRPRATVRNWLARHNPPTCGPAVQRVTPWPPEGPR
ncbi:hypothetical protein ACFVQ9_34905 [Streptomyces goshikiensis]|uniref:hypothetical protein n=1 Tax=Streptomyces goshikiensis TaxID=1942 RepID=UPI00368F6AC1